MKNKQVKQMMASILFNSKFLSDIHSIVDFDYPVLTVWNSELSIEQFACLSRKAVSLTANQLKGK